MTDFFRDIYRNEAGAYERMVAHEDFQGNISRLLERIRPFAGLDVVDLGAGTGRLSRLVSPRVNRIVTCDISPPMLAVARDQLTQGTCLLVVADNRRLPLATAVADVAMAGWSLGHSTGWYPQQWRREIGLALEEMRRILRPGGTLILLETLGTGREKPKPPTRSLRQFYQWLEDVWDFESTWIRTDFRFESAKQAAEHMRFFFGDDLADRILREDLAVVPECTGIWWCHVDNRS